MDDFYEDDEPIEKILEIANRPPDGITARPDAIRVSSHGSVSFTGCWITDDQGGRRPIPDCVVVW